MSVAVDAVAPPDTTAIEGRQQKLSELVGAMVVDSPRSLVACESLVSSIDREIKEVEVELNPGIKKANDLHKHLTKQRAKYLDPLREIKAIGKGKGLRYRRELEEVRRAEEDRRRAAARKEEEDRKLVEALKLIREGHPLAADDVLEQPTVAPIVVVPPTAPPPPKRMYVEKWTARIDKPGDVPREWCVPDQVALNARARTLKGEAVGTVKGVTFYDASGL